MNDAPDAAAAPVGAQSAGRLLREARERQGLHIAALAASIKVTQKKLELLEADRFDALPDATFARALALTVCRALKIDSTAVLRLLPPAGGHRLEQVGEGLNAPFHERPGVSVQRDGAPMSFGWIFWLTTFILIAAAVVYFLPVGWLGQLGLRAGVAAPVASRALAAPDAAPATSPSVAAPSSESFAESPDGAASGTAPASAFASMPGAESIPPAEATQSAPSAAAPPAPSTPNAGSGR